MFMFYYILLLFNLIELDTRTFDRRDAANINELIMMRIFYARPDHFLYRQYIAKNWFEFLSKCIKITMFMYFLHFFFCTDSIAK